MLARLIVLFAMLLMAFIGLILTDINKTGAFRYWQWVAIIFAVLALILSWYEKRKTSEFRPAMLARELLHWFGLNAAVYLVSLYVSLGLFSRFEAALFVLTLLSLAVYLAGLYIEIAFCLIGLILGFFAMVVAFFEEYLYAIAVPIILLSGGFFFWNLMRRKKTPPN